MDNNVTAFKSNDDALINNHQEDIINDIKDDKIEGNNLEIEDNKNIVDYDLNNIFIQTFSETEKISNFGLANKISIQQNENNDNLNKEEQTDTSFIDNNINNSKSKISLITEDKQVKDYLISDIKNEKEDEAGLLKTNKENKPCKEDRDEPAEEKEPLNKESSTSEMLDNIIASKENIQQSIKAKDKEEINKSNQDIIENPEIKNNLNSKESHKCCSNCLIKTNTNGMVFPCNHFLCNDCLYYSIIKSIDSSSIMSEFIKKYYIELHCFICCEGKLKINSDTLLSIINNNDINAPIAADEDNIIIEESFPICEACEDQSYRFLCTHCETYFCEDCLNGIHNKNKKNKDHIIKDLKMKNARFNFCFDCLEKIKSSIKSEDKQDKKTIKIRKAEYYCLTCEREICETCSCDKRIHPAHQITNIKLLYSSLTSQIKNNSRKFTSLITSNIVDTNSISNDSPDKSEIKNNTLNSISNLHLDIRDYQLTLIKSLNIILKQTIRLKTELEKEIKLENKVITNNIKLLQLASEKLNEDIVSIEKEEQEEAKYEISKLLRIKNILCSKNNDFNLENLFEESLSEKLLREMNDYLKYFKEDVLNNVEQEIGSKEKNVFLSCGSVLNSVNLANSTDLEVSKNNISSVKTDSNDKAKLLTDNKYNSSNARKPEINADEDTNHYKFTGNFKMKITGNVVADSDNKNTYENKHNESIKITNYCLINNKEISNSNNHFSFKKPSNIVNVKNTSNSNNTDVDKNACDIKNPNSSISDKTVINKNLKNIFSAETGTKNYHYSMKTKSGNNINYENLNTINSNTLNYKNKDYNQSPINKQNNFINLSKQNNQQITNVRSNIDNNKEENYEEIDIYDFNNTIKSVNKENLVIYKLNDENANFNFTINNNDNKDFVNTFKKEELVKEKLVKNKEHNASFTNDDFEDIVNVQNYGALHYYPSSKENDEYYHKNHKESKGLDSMIQGFLDNNDSKIHKQSFDIDNHTENNDNDENINVIASHQNSKETESLLETGENNYEEIIKKLNQQFYGCENTIDTNDYILKTEINKELYNIKNISTSADKINTSSNIDDISTIKINNNDDYNSINVIKEVKVNNFIGKANEREGFKNNEKSNTITDNTIVKNNKNENFNNEGKDSLILNLLNKNDKDFNLKTIINSEYDIQEPFNNNKKSDLMSILTIKNNIVYFIPDKNNKVKLLYSNSCDDLQSIKLLKEIETNFISKVNQIKVFQSLDNKCKSQNSDNKSIYYTMAIITNSTNVCIFTIEFILDSNLLISGLVYEIYSSLDAEYLISSIEYCIINNGIEKREILATAPVTMNSPIKIFNFKTKEKIKSIILSSKKTLVYYLYSLTFKQDSLGIRVLNNEEIANNLGYSNTISKNQYYNYLFVGELKNLAVYDIEYGKLHINFKANDIITSIKIVSIQNDNNSDHDKPNYLSVNYYLLYSDLSGVVYCREVNNWHKFTKLIFEPSQIHDLSVYYNNYINDNNKDNKLVKSKKDNIIVASCNSSELFILSVINGELQMYNQLSLKNLRSLKNSEIIPEEIEIFNSFIIKENKKINDELSIKCYCSDRTIKEISVNSIN